MTRRFILSVVLVAYLLFLFDIAWLRFPATNPKPNWIPFHSMIGDWRTGGSGFVVNFLGNIIAFLPMGLMPRLICGRRITIWQVALFSLAISLAIETGQFISGRRVPDVDDLILNTIGGVLGSVLLRTLRPERQRTLAPSDLNSQACAGADPALIAARVSHPSSDPTRYNEKPVAQSRRD
jgi:glycopeptide antibiotics resistance protein